MNSYCDAILLEMMGGQNVLGAGKYMIAMLEGSFLGVTGIYRVVQIEFVKPLSIIFHTYSSVILKTFFFHSTSQRYCEVKNEEPYSNIFEEEVQTNELNKICGVSK